METRFVDTHCHLEEEEFREDLPDVINGAEDVGVVMITSPVLPETWERGLTIAENYSSVYLSIGMNPMRHQEVEHAIQFIRSHNDKIIAIGEVGLDHYRERNHTQRGLQEQAFRQMIQVAMELDVPLQVHSRSAGRRCLEVLDSEGIELVQMHAFDANSSLAGAASHEQGYYFSIPTSVVRSFQKRKLVKAVDIERLLLETDSPMLSCERGVRNVPANIDMALVEIANILGRDSEEMREIILENSFHLYPRITPI